jgi:dTDP-4-dehydrorhamnose reductase
MAKKKVLLLGSTGKMGSALAEAFRADYDLVCARRPEFDADDFAKVERAVRGYRPDIVINTIAHLGIEPSEDEPLKAFELNALYPRRLAQLSAEDDFLLVHFSTDAVFPDRDAFFTEDDTPLPVNVYGMTKYAGDLFVQAFAKRYYIARISVLFGETNKRTQFVEKMLGKLQSHDRLVPDSPVLRIADDIVCSPCYSKDVAEAVKTLVEEAYPYGVYHLANEGKASLYELMKEIVSALEIDAVIQKASYRDFPARGRKNTSTPITSKKFKPLRPWKRAVGEYCQRLKRIAEHA